MVGYLSGFVIYLFIFFTGKMVSILQLVWIAVQSTMTIVSTHLWSILKHFLWVSGRLKSLRQQLGEWLWLQTIRFSNMHTSKPSSWGPVIYNFQTKGRRFLSPAGGINTSRWPLKAAWCSAVRPALSDTFTLLSRGTRASAQRTALFAAAMWSGVCQFLSLAFTSAECFSNTWTASCEHIRTHL